MTTEPPRDSPAAAAVPAFSASARRPVATYSIVARDGTTGQLGVAVQSHWFSVGPIVPWAEAGVGAVATQALVDVRYGPMGLALMRGGRDAEHALRSLVASDEGQAVRQVAMIDARGNIAAHTGERAIAHAGHATGAAPDGSAYSCQANMMGPPGVPQAMAAAFERAQGDLAARLMAALHAAEAVGGDIRGRQSAALLVVGAQASGRPWEDRLIDLRVEDHPHPLEELDRFLQLHRAYQHMNAGDAAMERGDAAGALHEYGTAMGLAPEVAEMAFWTGISLVNAGRVDDAVPYLARAYADGDRWRELARRLPAAGLLPDEAPLLERITRIPAAPAAPESEPGNP